MKALRFIALLYGLPCLAVLVYLAAQQGPESPIFLKTVAKPKKKDAGDASTPTDSDLPKIPRSSIPKDKVAPEGLPTFKSDVTTIQVDVAVLDNKGRFIPKIRVVISGSSRTAPPAGHRLFGGHEAPMTVAMVIEFQQPVPIHWSEGWYQTLVAAYGFVENVKAGRLRRRDCVRYAPRNFDRFTTDRMKIQEAMQRLRIPGSPNRISSTRSSTPKTG